MHLTSLENPNFVSQDEGNVADNEDSQLTVDEEDSQLTVDEGGHDVSIILSLKKKKNNYPCISNEN